MVKYKANEMNGWGTCAVESDAHPEAVATMRSRSPSKSISTATPPRQPVSEKSCVIAVVAEEKLPVPSFR